MPALPTVLIVDDEPFNLAYLQQELEDRPLNILTAANGQQALDIIASQLPDMVLLDIMMPVMDGFQVLQQMKSNPLWEIIPVLIISASNDMASVVRGIEMGADDFLPKPFDPFLLHARLNAGLEKKRLRDIEKRYLQSLERELEIGRQIQADFLPKVIPQPHGWQIEAFFRPAREVAGDFYDVFELDESHLVLLLGDVTDKGVGSALFMALFRSLLRAVITMNAEEGMQEENAHRTPQQRIRQAVNLVNQYINTVHESSMFATLFLGVLDTRSGECCYINAGHDHPYLLRAGVIHTPLPPTGPVVGAIENVNYVVQNIHIQPGDTLVLYSDGIIDALDPSGEMYTQERWQALLNQPFPDQVPYAAYLAGLILEFIAGASQYDDISLLVVKRSG